ncbi:MAG: PQQ-dependent sugar dehydrogenase [Sphingomonas sp.]|nr:PQQ-dependent sugar dehydrogenase [Sphingomonas sp.]
MTLRLMQAAALTLLAACGSAPSSTAAQTSSQRPFRITPVASFSTPWAMDFLPGSGVRMTPSALVTEKEGRLWLVNTATGARQQVRGVPRVAVAGQGGLGDVVAHPGFAGNQRIYLTFVEAGPNGTSGAALGYGRLLFSSAARPGAPAGVSLSGFKVIWRQAPKVSGDGHFSHRIAFAPDGTIFLTSGEREKMQPAQDMRSDLGKIHHLTAEGAPVRGNPFANQGGRAAMYWTLGHRNVLGIAFAPDGRLWTSEMGPKGGDELNLILPGRNYGWPIASYGSHYGGANIPDDHRGRRFEEPKVWWNPAISPGGLLIYSGDLFSNWKGDALLPALSGEALIRVDIDGDRARKADHWPMGARIRAVDQGPRGEIYLLEDGGRLLRLEPRNR